VDLRKVFKKDDLAEVAKKSTRLFSLYDTDRNRLVDAYEVRPDVHETLQPPVVVP
jgi:hypothetical protein